MPHGMAKKKKKERERERGGGEIGRVEQET